ncbi:MAG: alpha/beta hydrolase, partial [Pseudomonadota bacterium]
YDDPFVQFVSGSDGMLSEAKFDAWQASWDALSPNVNAETGLIIYIDDFPEMLSGLDVPVLALFGEKDTSVDWRAARALYEKTIGENPDASLTVKTFADGNHNLHVAETGGFREMLGLLKAPEMVPGYYDVMVGWLTEVVR